MFKPGARFNWYETDERDSWNLEVLQIQFDGHDFLVSEAKALIEPGYEYIGVPLDDYVKYERSVREHWGDDIDCNTLKWCFIKKPCENT